MKQAKIVNARAIENALCKTKEGIMKVKVAIRRTKPGATRQSGDWRAIYAPGTKVEDFFDGPLVRGEKGAPDTIYVRDDRREFTGEEIWPEGKWTGLYGKPSALLKAVAETAGIDLASVELKRWEDGRELVILRAVGGIFKAEAGLEVLPEELIEERS